MRPQRRRGPAAPRLMVADAGRMAAFGIQHVARETLEQARLGRRRCQGGAAAPAPASTPASRRARRRSRPDACPASSQRRSPRSGGDKRPERRCARCPRPERARGGAATKMGSSTVPDGIRQRPPVEHRDRLAQSAAAAEEARAVSLELGAPAATRPSTTAWCATQISGSSGARRRRVASSAPGLRRIRSARTSSRMRDGPDRRPAAPAPVRLYEVTSMLRARLPLLVSDDAAHFGIVFRRDQHLRASSSWCRRARTNSARSSVKVDFVAIRLDAARLIAGRPHTRRCRHRAG